MYYFKCILKKFIIYIQYNIFIIVDLYLMWSTKHVYLRRFCDAALYREKSISVLRSQWKGFVWSKKFCLRVVAWKSGSSNSVLSFPTAPTHGRA